MLQENNFGVQRVSFLFCKFFAAKVTVFELQILYIINAVIVIFIHIFIFFQALDLLYRGYYTVVQHMKFIFE